MPVVTFSPRVSLFSLICQNQRLFIRWTFVLLFWLFFLLQKYLCGPKQHRSLGIQKEVDKIKSIFWSNFKRWRKQKDGTFDWLHVWLSLWWQESNGIYEHCGRSCGCVSNPHLSFQHRYVRLGTTKKKFYSLRTYPSMTMVYQILFRHFWVSPTLYEESQWKVICFL